MPCQAHQVRHCPLCRKAHGAARQARYRRAHPDRKASPIARRQTYRRHANKRREEARELLFRWRHHCPAIAKLMRAAGLYLRTNLNPKTAWMSPSGQIFAEDTRSAEQVIRDFEKQQKKEGAPP